MESEVISIQNVDNIPKLLVIPNLKWLIPMAIKCGFNENVLIIKEG